MGRYDNYKNPVRDHTGQFDSTEKYMKEWARKPPKKRKPTMAEIEKQKEMERITMEKRKL